jgi:hypothetical protein
MGQGAQSHITHLTSCTLFEIGHASLGIIEDADTHLAWKKGSRKNVIID